MAAGEVTAQRDRVLIGHDHLRADGVRRQFAKDADGDRVAVAGDQRLHRDAAAVLLVAADVQPELHRVRLQDKGFGPLDHQREAHRGSAGRRGRPGGRRRGRPFDPPADAQETGDAQHQDQEQTGEIVDVHYRPPFCMFYFHR